MPEILRNKTVCYVDLSRICMCMWQFMMPHPCLNFTERNSLSQDTEFTDTTVPLQLSPNPRVLQN